MRARGRGARRARWPCRSRVRRRGHIAELNLAHRGKAGPTDVLSFPIDGTEPAPGDVPRELGDIVICPEHTGDVGEAVVHGMLHLLGMDHESDDGEMLALQRELLLAARA